MLGTSVLTPTLRYHPSIVAQAFAHARLPRPGPRLPRRRHGRGDERDAAHRRRVAGRARSAACACAEAIELIRRLWTEERVDFEGDYYRTERATIYDKPEEPVPIYVAASGPLAAKLAGRVGDGFICTSGKDPQLYPS